MSSTVTLFPPTLSMPPPEAQNRPAEPSRLRPVEPVTRVHPQQRRSSLGAFLANREQATGDLGLRRLPIPAPTFKPARPSSDGFFAQVMSQAVDGHGNDRKTPAADASARGTEAYRKAGAEPAFLSEAPEYFRIVA